MSSKECATPPSSDIEQSPLLPPSPPLSPKRSAAALIAPVDRLIGILHLLRAGRYPLASDLLSFSLWPTEFETLQDRIVREQLQQWFEAKVRYDYDGRRFTLRMPSATHERFIASVEDRIFAGIDELAKRLAEEKQDAISTALKGIYKGRSTTLELHAPKLENCSQASDAAEKVVRRSPDATFYCNAGDEHQGSGVELPPLVVEVSYSQQRKDLPRLAESYIIDSQHAIRCVVGLDITYSNAKGKTRGITCDGEVQLTLADILPKPVLENLPATAYDEHITIPFSDLAAFLYQAELDAASRRPKPATSSPKKFRKRKRSPSEELSDERESSFVKLEEADNEKERKADGDWQQPRRRIKTEPLEGTPAAIVERRGSKRTASGRAVGSAS